MEGAPTYLGFFSPPAQVLTTEAVPSPGRHHRHTLRL
jgi:hypothetical protein